MISSLRPFLVIFLVLLQFIAPLVHAHTGEKNSSQGIHIPGLEAYEHSSNTALQCKVVALCSDIDGQIVGVGTGFSRDKALPIQRFYKKVIADLDNAYYLLLQPTIPHRTLAFFHTPSVEATLLTGQLSHFTHSPRAPPLAA